jgi:hypothetical protein
VQKATTMAFNEKLPALDPHEGAREQTFSRLSAAPPDSRPDAPTDDCPHLSGTVEAAFSVRSFHTRAVARSLSMLFALLLTAGCAANLQGDTTGSVSGTPEDAAPPESAREQALAGEAHRLLERRCAVCHGCYDAPCQLVLSSLTGLARGASKREVYDGSRLFAIEPSRLFVDARSERAWRAKGFYSVLEGKSADAPAESAFARMLDLKQRNPLPTGVKLASQFALDIESKRECPRVDELDGFEKKHPLWGMPYALPALSPSEHATLVQWAESGAKGRDVARIEEPAQAAIVKWEHFLNQPSHKAQLMARYIYEHLFLASLYFGEPSSAAEPERERAFFRLIRSRTKSGEPADEIETRRPFDDPGARPFYYRIVPRLGTVLVKTHMPYPLNEQKLARFTELFLTPDYQVRELPSYQPEAAANPFVTYAALPVDSRYRFMLDEAHFTISGFIKGPVCRGQVALDVIDDRFWITFVDPRSPAIAREAGMLARSGDNLRLPAEQGSNGALINWRRYARAEKRHLKVKSDFLAEIATSPALVTLAQIWDGDAENDNAALTVLRHFDNATVVKGLVGGSPKTVWVVSYAILERIHYLLVAGFDVFGNVGHQLHTRLYMDFLRMESEHNYLLLLPKDERRARVDAWYRKTSERTKDLVYGKVARFDQESGIAYPSRASEHELHAMLHEHLAPILEHKYDLASETDRRLRTALAQLERVPARAATLLPELSFLEVTLESGAARHHTIARDSGHTNVAHLFREHKRRLPNEDRLTVLRGLVGAYPHVLFRVHERELPAFVGALERLNGESAYAALRDRFSVRRTSPDFWSHSDRLHDDLRSLEPLASGLLDYNRLDDR